MSDSRDYQVTALVLRTRDYGEGHQIVSLFTREEGKVSAIARGIKKPRAKLASALQHFTLGEVMLARGKKFDVITQVHVLNSFYGLRASMEAVAYAGYFAELFDVSLEERQQQTELFDLLVDALGRLANGEDPELLARYVEIHAIAQHGYLPHLTQCARCGQPLASRSEDGQAVWPTWLGFSAARGGALCPTCLPATPGARRIAAGTVQVARLMLMRDASTLGGLQLSDRLRREIETVFREYLEYRLERRLQSTRLLRSFSEPAPDVEEPEPEF